jgi:hypothetical protein
MPPTCRVFMVAEPRRTVITHSTFQFLVREPEPGRDLYELRVRTSTFISYIDRLCPWRRRT